MIDLSQMKGITIDPARRIARAETGLKLGEFDRATQEYGWSRRSGWRRRLESEGLLSEEAMAGWWESMVSRAPIEPLTRPGNIAQEAVRCAL
jgi:hypothetical protein